MRESPLSNSVDAYLGILVFFLGRRKHAGKNMAFFDILFAHVFMVSFLLFARLYFCGRALISPRGFAVVRHFSFFIYSPQFLASSFLGGR